MPSERFTPAAADVFLAVWGLAELTPFGWFRIVRIAMRVADLRGADFFFFRGIVLFLI